MIYKLKNYLLAGLLVWMPVGLTIWLIKLVVTSVDSFLPKLITVTFGIKFPGSGLLLALIILLITGAVAKNIIGQRVISLWDKLIMRIPIVKSIYKGVKQVSDTLLSTNGNAFRKALLVKFPHQDTFTIAFITGKPSFAITEHLLHDSDGDTAQHINLNSNDYINVYVPTTPNPTSGYFIIVNKKDTRVLDMSVDQALRYVISMGAINPKED